jgi:DNA-binding response OmpR family regulator
MGMDARILLVDDDDVLRGLLRTLLSSHGYSVAEASTCNLAISLLGSQPFDLVLLDITLPDGSGFSVAEFLREKNIPSKVIVLTGTNGLDIALKGASLGVQDYISKPFKPQYLLNSIRHALSLEISN